MSTPHSLARRLALAGLLSAAIAAHAELNFQPVTVDASYVAYERDVADVNGDGANDIVCVSEGEALIRAFLAPAWTGVTLATPTGAHTWPRADDFKAADLDGDGDADLVVRLGPAQNSDAAGVAAWFENNGAGGWIQHTIGTSGGYVKDICTADLDGDGRRDVVMRQDAETQIYFQEAAGWTTVTVSHPAHEGMEVADVDGDGHPDLVLNGFWFATPATPAAARVAANYAQVAIDPAWYNQTGDWTANSCKVVVGDVDGDGRQDVVFSQSERAGHEVAWYSSATPRVAGSWARHAVRAIDYCHNLQAADWDADGDTDLLVGGMPQSQHRGLRLLLNDGTGTAWSTHVLRSDGSYSAETGDLDNDGDLDVVGIVNWDSAPTFILRNNAGGGPSLDFWLHHEVSAAHVRTFGLCFPDVDADGDLDVASGRFLYLNPGAPLASPWTQVTLPGSGHAFACLDVDGDAFADLLLQQDNAGANRLDVLWAEASNATGTSWGTPVTVGHVPRSEHVEGSQGCRIAQTIAGGRPEILVSSIQGVYAFSVPAANPAAGGWPRLLLAANDSDEGIGVADLDADGDPDLAFTSGGSKQVKWARNPGDGGGWAVFTIGSFPEADWPDRCEAVDLNGDGRVDLVVTEENSGVAEDALACWWEQPAGGATQGNWTRHTIATRYTLNSLDAADLDQDGDVDLVLAEHRGDRRIGAWQNDGTGAFTGKPVDAGRESHLGGRLADLDADGDLDLVSIAYDDYAHLHLWRNDSPSGAPTVARPAFSPPGGVFDAPVAVSLTCATPAAAIWYTQDGGEPTNQPPSLPYSGTPVTIGASVTLRARAFREGFRPSPLAQAVFTGPQAQAPQFSPPGGTFASTQLVAISCATAGVTIRYTVNGGEPQPSDTAYATPLLLTESATLRARAFGSGLLPSPTATATFTRFTLGTVAHWRLDERFGSLAFDSSGHAHTGTVSGAAGSPGLRDHALRFDGADDRVSCGAWDVTGTAITFTAWAWLDPAFVDNDARIVAKAVGPQEQDHWWMLSTTTVGAARRLRVRLKAGGTTTTLIASTGDIPLAAWVHLAASYDAVHLRLFVNGVQVGETAKGGTLDVNAAVPVWIGANPPSAYAPFRGLLDDVRIYNVALDAAGVAAVMNDTSSDGPPRLLRLEPHSPVGWQVAAQGTPGHWLELQRATNLLAPQWIGIRTQALDTAPSALFTDEETLPRAFYRLRRE